MGNFVTTGSRVSENREGVELGDLNGLSDDKSKANDVKMESVDDFGPVEDYVMSEASSFLNTKQDSRDDVEEENGFHVGDFVWVEEANRHQWWPGKIYDSSDASDLALKQMQKGTLLVAYCWKETFAWCNPSQLKPFLENFREFSKTSDSSSFLGAVEEAVREIGQHVENLLGCDKALVSSVAVNYGVKEGVLVPDVRRATVMSLVLEKPGIVLDDVRNLAKTATFSDLLEIEVLKSKISAFYRSKGRFDLAKYDEPRYIIGLEDREDKYAMNFDKSSWQRSLSKCSRLASNKKRKEVNKVVIGDVATTGSTTLRTRVSDVLKIENADLKQVEEIRNEKSFSPGKRKSKSNNIEKREESNDSNHLEENEKKEESGIEITVDLSTPLASLCKRAKVDVSSSAERNNESGVTIVQTGKRERKKSKYLSPEYMTDFSWSTRKRKIESESSQVRAAERLTKSSAEKAINFVRLGATPEEILDLIRGTALNTQYPKDYKSSYDMIRGFASIYRSFAYDNGAHSKSHNRNVSDEDKQPEVVDELEQARTVKKNKREVEKQFSGVELYINSGFGSTLPSKDNLMRTYKNFGALDEEKSCMFENNTCARVSFLNVSDGEEAFKKSLEKCPFAATYTVTFGLKYPSSESPENAYEKNEAENKMEEIECLKKKLEEIRALLDQSEGGEITEALKMKLEDESRNLLEKVRKMTVPSF